MDKKTLQNIALLNITNYGNAIVDSAFFQMKNGEFNEDTFRNWIKAIEYELYKLNNEGTDDDKH